MWSSVQARNQFETPGNGAGSFEERRRSCLRATTAAQLPMFPAYLFAFDDPLENLRPAQKGSMNPHVLGWVRMADSLRERRGVAVSPVMAQLRAVAQKGYQPILGECLPQLGPELTRQLARTRESVFMEMVSILHQEGPARSSTPASSAWHGEAGR